MKKCMFCWKEINDNDVKCGHCWKEQHVPKGQPAQSVFMVGNKNANQSSPPTHTNNKSSSHVNVFATGNNTVHKTNNTSNVSNKNPFATPSTANNQNSSVNAVSNSTTKKTYNWKLYVQTAVKKIAKIKSIKRKWVYTMALIIIIIIGGCFVYRNLATGSLYSNENIYKSIVEIIVGTWNESQFQWSAIIFSKDGLILTNNHVIENENFWSSFNDIQVCILEEITAEPNCDYTADLIVRNPSEDLAILKIKDYDWENYINLFHGIKTPKTQYLEKRIKVIGYPWLWWEKMTVTKWIIAWFDKNDDFKTDAEINHWNSWGWSFDEDNVFLWVPYYAVSDDNWKISYIISIFNIKKRFSDLLYKQPKNNAYSSEYFLEKNIKYDNYNMKQNSVDSEKVHDNFAWIEHNTTKYNEVIKKIGDILDIVPSSPLAYEYMGDVYYDLWQYDKALEMYNYSLELDPYVITANAKYGSSLIALGRYEDAISIYEDLIPIFEYDNESLAIIYEALWICYEAIWDNDSADSYYFKAKEMNKGN